MRTFKIQAPGNLQTRRTVPLTCHHAAHHPHDLCFLQLAVCTWDPLYTFHPPPNLPHSWQPPCCSPHPWVLFCFCSVLQISQVSDIMWYLSFSVLLISLRIMPSRSIQVITNGKISFSFFGHALWDLSSLTREETCAPCNRSMELNHWISREVSTFFFFSIAT